MSVTRGSPGRTEIHRIGVLALNLPPPPALSALSSKGTGKGDPEARAGKRSDSSFPGPDLTRGLHQCTIARTLYMSTSSCAAITPLISNLPGAWLQLCSGRARDPSWASSTT